MRLTKRCRYESGTIPVSVISFLYGIYICPLIHEVLHELHMSEPCRL